MERTTVAHGDLSVTVTEATALVGMRRTRLKLEAHQADEQDVDRRWLHELTYADLVACVVASDGFDPWPPVFDDFVELPDAFVVRWETAVYDLNPHWLPQKTEAAEKKDVAPPMSSIDG